MEVDWQLIPSVGRDLKALTKKFPKIGSDMEKWFDLQSHLDIETLGDMMQGKPSYIDVDLIKIRVPLKSHNLSAKKGPRVIGKVAGSRLVILFVYTHDQYENQPKWEEIARRIDESNAAA